MAKTVHIVMPAIAVGALAVLPEEDLTKLYNEAVETRIAKSGEGAT